MTQRTATAFALGNACVIASYTLLDGLGVRRSGAPAAYALWIFLLNGTEQLLLILIWRRREFAAYLKGRLLQALAGGVATVALKATEFPVGVPRTAAVHGPVQLSN